MYLARQRGGGRGRAPDSAGGEAQGGMSVTRRSQHWTRAVATAIAVGVAVEVAATSPARGRRDPGPFTGDPGPARAVGIPYIAESRPAMVEPHH